MEEKKTNGIIVAPLWTTQPWFSEVGQLSIDCPRLPARSRTLIFPYEPRSVYPLNSTMCQEVFFVDFSRGRNTDHSSPALGTVTDFWTSLFNRGLGYSCINTARSALSCTLYADSDTPIGQHPSIVRVMKGVSENCPAFPRNNIE